MMKYPRGEAAWTQTRNGVYIRTNHFMTKVEEYFSRRRIMRNCSRRRRNDLLTFAP